MGWVMTKKKADTKASHNNLLSANNTTSSLLAAVTNNKTRLGLHLIKTSIIKKRVDYFRWGIVLLAAGICDLAKWVLNGRQ